MAPVGGAPSVGPIKQYYRTMAVAVARGIYASYCLPNLVGSGKEVCGGWGASMEGLASEDLLSLARLKRRQAF